MTGPAAGPVSRRVSSVEGLGSRVGRERRSRMSEPPQANLHAQVHAECKRELGSQTDRGAAILGATFLEVRLEEAIRSRLVGTGDPVESLFRGGAALGTFSAKTDMAFALGFYGPKVHRDLT